MVKSTIDPNFTQFAQKVPESVFVTDLDTQQYDFALVLEVLDSNKAGIFGKYPKEIKVIPENPNEANDILANFVYEHSLFEASEVDGIATVPITITKLTHSLKAIVEITMDDLVFRTSPIEFMKFDQTDDTMLSRMEITKYPEDLCQNGMKMSHIWSMSAVAYDMNGDVPDLDNYNFELEIFFNPVSQAPARKHIIVLRSEDYYIRRGEITFPENQIMRGERGHYYYRVNAYHKENPSKIIVSSTMLQ